MNETAELKIKILEMERAKLSKKAENLLNQIENIDLKIKKIKEFENSRTSKSSRPSSQPTVESTPTIETSDRYADYENEI